MAQVKSFFSTVQAVPADKIFATKTRYKKDKDPKKVNLGIGAYRDDSGKPIVLPIVRKVEKILANDNNLMKEYLGIGGDEEFVAASQKLILGNDSNAIKNGFVAGVQGVSGTGSLRVLFSFIKANFGSSKIFISDPTWGNHKKVIKHSGLEFDTYKYWDAKNRKLAIKEMLADIDKKAKAGDIVLLHACAHNPTGVDPDKDQWNQILDLLKKKSLTPFFDSAYQGFATGNLDNDAFSVRLAEKKGLGMFIAQSFAKNLGLYCERIGCASVVTGSKEQKAAVLTQLKAVIRPMYSNPPAHGARIVKMILNNEQYRKEWYQQMSEMSNRILKMRQLLRQNLENLKTPGTWMHITSQIGMFTFSGLTPEQVEVMEKKYHIYLLSSGRISMAGVCSGNVEYLAKAMDDVVRNVLKK